MYYSAYDLQCKRYFESGANSETEAECLIDVCTFLIDGEDMPDTTPSEEILSIFEVEIHEHEKQIFTNEWQEDFQKPPQFTEGRWLVRESGACVVGVCGKTICQLINIEDGALSITKEVETNARLISKAPEMFSLLKQFSSEKVQECNVLFDQAVSDAKAIINKMECV